MTQGDVAAATGLSIKTVTDIENMEQNGKSPTLRSIEAVLSAVGVSIIIKKNQAPTLDDILQENNREFMGTPDIRLRYRKSEPVSGDDEPGLPTP